MRAKRGMRGMSGMRGMRRMKGMLAGQRITSKFHMASGGYFRACFTYRPKTDPKSRNSTKTPRSHALFREVRANFCLLPCDTSQEPNGNCSEKLVQMNIFILGGFSSCDQGPLMEGL